MKKIEKIEDLKEFERKIVAYYIFSPGEKKIYSEDEKIYAIIGPTFEKNNETQCYFSDLIDTKENSFQIKALTPYMAIKSTIFDDKTIIHMRLVILEEIMEIQDLLEEEKKHFPGYPKTKGLEYLENTYGKSISEKDIAADKAFIPKHNLDNSNKEEKVKKSSKSINLVAQEEKKELNNNQIKEDQWAKAIKEAEERKKERTNQGVSK